MRNVLSILVLLAAAWSLSGCGRSSGSSPSPVAGGKPALVSPEIRGQLAELMKGHDDKMQLAWYVSSPLHSVDPAVRTFFNHMYDDQKRLRNELQAWADTHHCNLKFSYSNDIAGRARKLLEDSQGEKLQHDDNQDFQRDVLVMMDLDFASQKALATELLKVAPDAQLRTYLQESIQTHEAEIRAVRVLLRRYTFQ